MNQWPNIKDLPYNLFFIVPFLNHLLSNSLAWFCFVLSGQSHSTRTFYSVWSLSFTEKSNLLICFQAELLFKVLYCCSLQWETTNSWLSFTIQCHFQCREDWKGTWREKQKRNKLRLSLVYFELHMSSIKMYLLLVFKYPFF